MVRNLIEIEGMELPSSAQSEFNTSTVLPDAPSASCTIKGSRRKKNLSPISCLLMNIEVQSQSIKVKYKVENKS